MSSPLRGLRGIWLTAREGKPWLVANKCGYALQARLEARHAHRGAGVLLVRLVVVLMLIAAPIMAGCAANPIPRSAEAAETTLPTIAADWFEIPLARGGGHNHGDLAQHHGMSTPNFQLVGHAPLTTYDASGRIVGTLGCGEISHAEDGRQLAIMNAFDREAIVLADITDPAAPFKVGEFVVADVSAYDAALTPDGKFGLVAFNALVRMPDLGAAVVPRIEFVDDCTGQARMIPIPDVAVHNGIIMLDLSDPSEPTFTDYWPTPSFNLHSVVTAEVDGITYAVASIVNLVPSASYWQFLAIVDSPVGGKIVPLSHFQQPPIAVSEASRVVVPTFNGHGDAQIQKHPALGLTLAYLAGWDGGIITVDITVPTAPVMIANWAPPASANPVAVSSGLTDSGCYAYAVHDAYPLPALIDGKHYLLAQQECPFAGVANKPGGQVFILDNTNPILPTLVGAWNLPVSTAPWTTQYQASPHYVAVMGDTLFVTMYHAGLWAVDLSGDVTAPPAIGVYMPDVAPPVNSANSLKPSTLQVNPLPDGNLAIFEERSGVYILRFDETNPAPPALPFFRLT